MLQGIGGEEATTIWLQGLSQRKMSTMIDEENFGSLRRQTEAEGNAREIARLASLGLPYAGAFLEAVPNLLLACISNPASLCSQSGTDWAAQSMTALDLALPARDTVMLLGTMPCAVATRVREYLATMP